MNDGVYLQFYVQESKRHHGGLVYDWLLREARSLGLKGGTAFRGIAGFGRHGVMHEDHFFELAGELPVLVTFTATRDEAARMVDHVAAAGLTLFFVEIPVRFGSTDGHDD